MSLARRLLQGAAGASIEINWALEQFDAALAHPEAA